MKMGLLSAILADYSFEDMIAFAADQGFSCVEVACWPPGRAKRRYAGVSHIDVSHMTEEYTDHILDTCRRHQVAISSLAYYPNMMDHDPSVRRQNIDHLKKVIEASARLGIHMVTTFTGKDQEKTVEENMKLFREIWPPIIRFAEEQKVRIAIENCPMLFDAGQWPGGQNLAATPSIWRQMFEAIDSPYLGINYDPSHCIWQMLDYIGIIYEFRDKIFHVHLKDIKLYPDRLKEVGTLAYPLEYMSPKLPGLGDIDWGKFISALLDIGYDGYACIEIEDRAFEGSPERILDSIRQSAHYLRQFLC